MQSCSVKYCQRVPQYSYTKNSFYTKCPYHGLNPPQCNVNNCTKLTEFSIGRNKFYQQCPKHGGVNPPKCVMKKCDNLTEFSPTKGIFHSKCPEHGLPKQICTTTNCTNTTKYDYENSQLFSKCDNHNIPTNNRFIRVCEEIKTDLFFQWIISPFKPLSKKESNIQSLWENNIMARNGQLNFWFELDDIAVINDISVDDIVIHLKYLEKKNGLNLMHAELVRNPKAIRFANNNQDILHDAKTANWIHNYLNTFKIIY